MKKRIIGKAFYYKFFSDPNTFLFIPRIYFQADVGQETRETKLQNIFSLFFSFFCEHIAKKSKIYLFRVKIDEMFE